MTLDELDDDGNTALHLAVLRSDAGAVRTLLEYGANPNISNRAGKRYDTIPNSNIPTTITHSCMKNLDTNFHNFHSHTPSIPSLEFPSVVGTVMILWRRYQRFCRNLGSPFFSHRPPDLAASPEIELLLTGL
jgi:ankyrin repeat protein